MPHDFSGLYEATIGAAPTMLVAFVLEFRHVLGRNASRANRILGASLVVALCTAFIVSVRQWGKDEFNSDWSSLVVGCLVWASLALTGTFLWTFFAEWPE